jgi:hypothetical protein
MNLRPIVLLAALTFALPVLAQTAPKAAKSSGKSAAKPVSKPAALPLAAAGDEQLEAFKLAHLGSYECEFNQAVQILPHMKEAGYLDVSWKKDVYTMKPVLSSTGALRLEDVTGRTLMIQIANKSMLMDTKIGQRLVDECVHPMQRAEIEAAKTAPVVAGTGLGIDPNKAAAAATAAAATGAAAAATAGAAAAATQAAAAPVSSDTTDAASASPAASAPR